MNILFMTIGRMENIEDHTIYCDLLREFRNNGHSIYTISPYEKRIGKETDYKEINDVHMLHVRTGNVTKSSGLIEKGLAQLSLEGYFIAGIKKYFSAVKFDLVMYSTPPITLYKAINYLKKRDSARTCLLLKDIFPQNAVDLEMMQTSGVRGLLYKYFRKKEKKLYALSDHIGCMSQANVDYIIKHNPEIDIHKVEICPNSIEPLDFRIDESKRENMRKKYDIPLNKIVYVYGGNLGKPQGIPFLIECLKSQLNNKTTFFLIVGDGTEFIKLYDFFEKYQPSNMKLMKRLPKEEYDLMIAACDVGMIFLDHRFTIPNFPSRLLSYMQAGLPVLACTDRITDIGKVIIEGGFGWWCESNDLNEFTNCILTIDKKNLNEANKNSFQYLLDHYSVESIYELLINKLMY